MIAHTQDAIINIYITGWEHHKLLQPILRLVLELVLLPTDMPWVDLHWQLVVTQIKSQLYGLAQHSLVPNTKPLPLLLLLVWLVLELQQLSMLDWRSQCPVKMLYTLLEVLLFKASLPQLMQQWPNRLKVLPLKQTLKTSGGILLKLMYSLDKPNLEEEEDLLQLHVDTGYFMLMSLQDHNKVLLIYQTLITR